MNELGIILFLIIGSAVVKLFHFLTDDGDDY